MALLLTLEGATNGRDLYTPDEFTQRIIPSIKSQMGVVVSIMQKHGMRPPAQMQTPISAASPIVNNPAGVPIVLGKHNLRQEDLHIPDSKRRKSMNATSASPAPPTDPASVPPVSQTPMAIDTHTPVQIASTTPSGTAKRPSTGSPTATQPPSKVQIGPNGAVPVRDKAHDEAIQKRLVRARAEEAERQEERKDPLEYVKKQMFKAAGNVKTEQSGQSSLLPLPMQGLSDRKAGTNGVSPNGTTADKGATNGKGQLPSPPWSGTMTARQLAETFANTTDINFALKSSFLSHDEPSDVDSFGGLLMNDMLSMDDEEPQVVTAELGGLDMLSPFVGDGGWDDGAYSWTRNLSIPWNGDISNVLEQSSDLGVVA
jgi:hypothetical protein